MSDATVNVEKVKTIIKAITDGDLTGSSDPVGLDDSTGLVEALQEMRAEVLNWLGDMHVSSEIFHRSSKTMNETNRVLRDNAVQVQAETETVASSTSEMNSNMNTISAASEELSVNMQSISDAAKESNTSVEVISSGVGELTTASQEIAESTEKATEISRRALQSVGEASTQVGELEAAAGEINVVTSTISEISDQTKLLALNATIEAARAGEAGRGFAVVAKEVKDLASQTNAATKDIQSKISVIQTVTTKTIEAISSITGVMKEVDEVVTTIAAAAEEQSVTTQNIAGNIATITDRIKDMTASVSEGALAVQDVNRSINDVTELSNQVTSSVSGVNERSKEMKSGATTSYAQVLEATSLGEDIKKRLSLISFPSATEEEARNAPTALCRFSDFYSVSIDKMDDDHNQIFSYINQIHQSIKEQADLPTLTRITSELAAFTTDHFAREEELMASENYPQLDAQKRAHTKLLSRVGEYVGKMQAGEDLDMIEVMIFLKGWLQDHIQGMDKKYGPYLNEHGIH